MDLRFAELKYDPDTTEDTFELVLHDQVFRFIDQTDARNVGPWCSIIQHVMNTMCDPNEFGVRPKDIKAAYLFTCAVDGCRKDELATEAVRRTFTNHAASDDGEGIWYYCPYHICC